MEQVLCATSTLAVGVNLPAHLVVIKGTRRYTGAGSDGCGYVEYDKGTCLQMVGRAGRPGYDIFGNAVIMTQKSVSGDYAVVPCVCTAAIVCMCDGLLQCLGVSSG